MEKLKTIVIYDVNNEEEREKAEQYKERFINDEKEEGRLTMFPYEDKNEIPELTKYNKIIRFL